MICGKVAVAIDGVYHPKGDSSYYFAPKVVDASVRVVVVASVVMVVVAAVIVVTPGRVKENRL